MKTIFRPLAEMDFAAMLREAYADTQTGSALINKYRQYLLTNESTCTLVNKFLLEANNYQYDGGVFNLIKEISDIISENKVSWQLATACEAINNNNSSYNYLNRNAASSVEKLLEQNEEDVVKYIKAGALKHVMFCEAFRNIVSSVYTDVQTTITDDYSAKHPVSYVEENCGKQYFEVLGNIYSVEDNIIKEEKASTVSGDFLLISRLLESGNVKFDVDTEHLIIDTPLAVYEIYTEDECKKCKRVSKKIATNTVTETVEFDNEYSLREHNRLVVGASSYSTRNNTAELLESIARAYEHFENFVLLDNVQIIESKNDKFIVIENAENMFAYSIKSNHNTGWKINTTVVEVVDFIKKHTNLNIAKDYKKNIDEQIKKTEITQAKAIEESIEKDAMEARKRKIEMLTEKFKNEPATLAVLSKVAQSLNE